MHDLNNTNANANVHDDPRLTAYALGELDGDDAATIERLLAESPSLRSEVESIRAAATMLRQGYAAEPAATLTETQRHSIMRRPESGELREALRLAAAGSSSSTSMATLNAPAIFRMRSRWVASGLAAAAMIALAVTAAIMFQRGDETDEVAIESKSNQPLKDETAETRTAGGRVAGPIEQTSRVPAGAPALEKQAYKSTGERERAAGDLRAQSALDPAADEVRQRARDLNSPSAGGAVGADAGAGPGAGAGAGVGGSGAAGFGAVGQPAPPSASGTAASPARPAAAATPPSSRAISTASGGRGAPGAQSAAPIDDADATRERAEQAPASAPAEASRVPEVKVLSQEQIAAMDETQLRATLSRITWDCHRRANLSPEAAEQLRQQFSRLIARLRELHVDERGGNEEFTPIVDNPFVQPIEKDALSTFSADVDTAAYSNIRRMIAGENRLPPPDAVRIEDMLNYFSDYAYEPPSMADAAPFRANIEIAPAPWNPHNRLVRIGLRGKEVKTEARPATSLVFLIDVSRSMNDPNKLPLVKDALKMLVRQLHGDDRLGIVTYAGNARVALDSCYVNAENRERIEAAIDILQPSGSTNGAGGIVAAYDLAREHFIKGGVNRVILCTDGDFNVGVSSDDELVRLIEEQRKSNVFLSVLGFGAGNLKDGKMEKFSNAGNGNFAYIDSIDEAKKVLVKQMGSTLVTIAKDVKLQVQFNDQRVAKYRLIGYEDRMLQAEDFANDRKDAGEIGSGHMVTALYEVEPVGSTGVLAQPAPGADLQVSALGADDKAGQRADNVAAEQELGLKKLPFEHMLELRIRYKEPEGENSALLEFGVHDEGRTLESASADFRFAAAVAQFGMLLRESPFKGNASYAGVLDLAESALGEDKDGYRRQFMDIVRKAQALAAGQEQE